jgi:hypothetical protein
MLLLCHECRLSRVVGTKTVQIPSRFQPTHRRGPFAVAATGAATANAAIRSGTQHFRLIPQANAPRWESGLSASRKISCEEDEVWKDFFHHQPRILAVQEMAIQVCGRAVPAQPPGITMETDADTTSSKGLQNLPEEFNTEMFTFPARHC